jgi:ABC-type uncharacterized transport system auxiliary subunit
MKALYAILVLGACGGSVPQTRYYQLAAPSSSATPATTGTAIAVAPLTTDGAYDDERIVYRLDPVRLDYYDFHRWSTQPGAMIAAYLQAALAQTGEFGSVARESTATTAVVIGGHVVALEEIDVDAHDWVGHVALELTVSDAKSGVVLWAHSYDEREPEAKQSPEGLARAVGVAMGRIVKQAAPQIAELATRQAQARGLATTPSVAAGP